MSNRSHAKAPDALLRKLQSQGQSHQDILFLLGNALYSLLFFGCYELMKHYRPREQGLVH